VAQHPADNNVDDDASTRVDAADSAPSSASVPSPGEPLRAPIGELIRARLRNGEGGRLGRYLILRLLGEGGMGLLLLQPDHSTATDNHNSRSEPFQPPLGGFSFSRITRTQSLEYAVSGTVVARMRHRRDEVEARTNAGMTRCDASAPPRAVAHQVAEFAAEPARRSAAPWPIGRPGARPGDASAACQRVADGGRSRPLAIAGVSAPGCDELRAPGQEISPARRRGDLFTRAFFSPCPRG
jgi:hypothetical protein